MIRLTRRIQALFVEKEHAALLFLGARIIDTLARFDRPELSFLATIFLVNTGFFGSGPAFFRVRTRILLAFFVDSVPSFSNFRTRVPSSHAPFEAGRPFFFGLGARSLPQYAATLAIRDRPAFSDSTVALLPESTSTGALVPFLTSDLAFLCLPADGHGCVCGLECLDLIFGKALTRAAIGFLAGRACLTLLSATVALAILLVPNAVPVRAVFGRSSELVHHRIIHPIFHALAEVRMNALSKDALQPFTTLGRRSASALLR